MSRRDGFVACACVLGLVMGLALLGCEGKEKEPVTEPEPTAAPAVTPTPEPVVTPAETPAPEPTATEPTKAAKPGYPNPAPVKKTAAAPTIDGDLSDACWKSAQIAGVWVDVYSGSPAKPQPRVYVCYDDQNFYIGFYNPEPNMKAIVADATDRDGTTWSDDSNEMFIDPTAGKKDYLQFIVNTKAVLYDGRGRDGEWDSSAKVAVKLMDDAWSLEVQIPLSDLGVTGSPKGQTWTANFCRNRQTEGEAQAQAWADTGESFHNPEAFGKLKME